MAIKGLQVLYNLILKDTVKGSGQASGILSIGKDVRKLADKKFQNYVMSAQKQGVDLDKLSEQEIKYMLEMNKPKPPRVIAGDSPEGKAITEKLLGKKGGDVNIYSKQYIDNLDKEIIDSGLYTKKEWTNLSNELKEARRRKFDSNYDDAMEGTVESNVVDMTGKNIDTSQGIMGGKSVDDIEDFAYGGIAGMLGEPAYEDEEHRVPYQDGKTAEKSFVKLIPQYDEKGNLIPVFSKTKVS